MSAEQEISKWEKPAEFDAAALPRMGAQVGRFMKYARCDGARSEPGYAAMARLKAAREYLDESYGEVDAIRLTRKAPP